MVLPRVQSQDHDKKQSALIVDLQNQLHTLLFDRAMFNINDSLTSILAVCDAEAEQAVPKVKSYIQRINETLNSLKAYQAALKKKGMFDISLILKNVIHVIKEHIDRKVEFSLFLSEVKAPVTSDPFVVEQMLIFLFVELVKPEQGNGEVLVELRQNGKDAVITLTKNSCTFPAAALREFNRRRDEFTGKVQISHHDKGVEVTLRLPLKFESKASESKKSHFKNVISKIKMKVKRPFSTQGGSAFVEKKEGFSVECTL